MRLTIAQAPELHFSQGTAKGTSRRKAAPGRMKNGLALILLASRLNAGIGGAPLWDSA